MYFSRFLYTVLSKAFYIIKTRKTETKWAVAYIKRLEHQLNGKFDGQTFNKIITSYSIYNPMICDAFALLHGKTTNREERKRMLHYFICSSLFDNFCDRKELTPDALEQISFNSEFYVARDFDEKMFLYSHALLKRFVRNSRSYEQVTEKLFRAQQASMRQFDNNITDEEIKKITFEKGGYSVLLCSFYLDHTATPEEQQCWYRIGSIIQLINDLFDIYKDLQDGEFTLANRMTNAYSFNQFYLELVLHFKEEIKTLPCSIGAKKNFAISMMGICAFGWIALAQLKALQGELLLLPKLCSVSRRDLIVDMEKPENRWRWIKWVYQNGKL